MASKYPNLRRGLFMAALCAAMFALLPLCSQVALQKFSALSVAWFRLLFSAVCLALLLHLRGAFKPLVLRQSAARVLLAAGFLALNYFGYTKGIELSGASNAQMMIQLAQLGLVFLGVIVFRERLSKIQGLGIALAFLGLYLFVKDRAQFSLNPELYGRANWFLIVSAVSWSLYAALQKRLSQTGSTQLLNCLILGLASFFIFPTLTSVDFSAFSQILSWPGLLLLAAAVISLVAYMALAEALTLAPATLVSVVLVLNPIGTFVLVYFLNALGFSVSSLDLLSLTGALSAAIALLGVVIVVGTRKA